MALWALKAAGPGLVISHYRLCVTGCTGLRLCARALQTHVVVVVNIAGPLSSRTRLTRSGVPGWPGLVTPLNDDEGKREKKVHFSTVDNRTAACPGVREKKENVFI